MAKKLTALGAIGLRLKAIREAMDLTQAQFAERFGLSTRTAQSYERGDTYPSGEMLVALSGLGIDLNELLTGRPARRPDQKGEVHYTSIVTHSRHAPLQPGELDLDVLEPVLQAAIEEARTAKDMDWKRTAQRFAALYARQFGEVRGRR
ncbi:helix-turn-helix domain-containing protein [Dongia sp.]|uniref:helix-turn-helix domain-containing protein n=1 Tax=Dongia sp. TaxID=1977262 RepID=UPI0035AEEAD6